VVHLQQPEIKELLALEVLRQVVTLICREVLDLLELFLTLDLRLNFLDLVVIHFMVLVVLTFNQVTQDYREQDMDQAGLEGQDQVELLVAVAQMV
jgi:hypothetical protein